MKAFIRAMFLFTSLHFVLFFLCAITYGFQRLIGSQNHEDTSGSLSVAFNHFFHFLSLPLGLSFWQVKEAAPTIPLFVLLANSFIWGFGLAVVQALLESARDSGEKPSHVSAKQKHVSFPLEVIFLFIILTLLWSALSFLDIGFNVGHNQNILVAYLKKLAVFPTVPFFLPEKAFEEMAFFGDLPVVLLNMVLWSLLLALLLRAFRHLRGETSASTK